MNDSEKIKYIRSLIVDYTKKDTSDDAQVELEKLGATFIGIAMIVGSE